MWPIEDKQKVIERLCALVTEVGEKKFDNTVTHDCFCGMNQLSKDTFSVDEAVIEFIEEAVREKLVGTSADYLINCIKCNRRHSIYKRCNGTSNITSTL